jgi:hypothetical protein
LRAYACRHFTPQPPRRLPHALSNQIIQTTLYSQNPQGWAGTERKNHEKRKINQGRTDTENQSIAYFYLYLSVCNKEAIGDVYPGDNESIFYAWLIDHSFQEGFINAYYEPLFKTKIYYLTYKVRNDLRASYG